MRPLGGHLGLVLLLTRPSEGISGSLWASLVAERDCCELPFGALWVVLPHGAFLGCFFRAKKRLKIYPQTGPTNASKKDDCQRQKRPKHGTRIDEKTTPKNMLEKRDAKGRGTSTKHVLGAPCKLKMGISLGMGYKNEQWQLICSRSLSAHRNIYF